MSVDVSSNTQSASSTKRLKSARSQATLHNFIKRLEKKSLLNLLLYMSVGVSSNTQSASSTKRLKSACSQTTLHNFIKRLEKKLLLCLLL